MTSAVADHPAPAPPAVVWLADRWRRVDHAALLTRVTALTLALAVAVLLAGTPLFLPDAVGSSSWAEALVRQGWASSDEHRFGLVATCAGLLGVVAVLLAVRLPWLATVVALVPFALVPLYGTALASSWLAVAAVAVVVATSRPIVALVPWAAAGAIGVAWAHGFDPTGRGGMAALFPHGPGYPSTGPAGVEAGLGLAAYAAGALGVAAWLGHALRTAAARTRQAVIAADDARAESALVAERTRLARELHDVVAHHVSLVAVRAESTPYGVPDLDPRAAQAFACIADDARTALAELRHVLTVLRRGDDAPLGPLSGASDVPALVAAARGAGQDVTVEGGWPDLAGGVGHVLHRAVQEGLSNARRHAPDAAVRLVLAADGGVVGFRMSNAVSVSATGVPAHGLTGMRERVEALGGSVATEVDDGTFVLVVTLPLDAP
ncbi:sensor histidine kinase [Cellulomonas sp. HD19AZ1]|uniref:sensor histidine kinase n=1 Tax=Cellulomonas sp. HD19AZ1 TaxID=2559593 RepID=UPI0010708859|nr:histidine kinase [Cellulomonas sp. HD19AZ1]TFH70069.1 hypothetical protein E4A51_14715 [Cellulomonas sp. HD19AZ1]